MKRKTQVANTLPDIVKIVLAIMKEEHINKTELGKRCKWKPSTVTALFKKRVWTTSEVKQVGLALKRNLWLYFMDEKLEGMVPSTIVEDMQKESLEKDERIKKLEEDNSKLRTENELMKKMLKIKEEDEEE